MALLDGTAPWRRAVEPELPVQDTGVYPRCPTYWTATTPPLHSRRRRLPRRSPSTVCSIRCPRPRSPSEGRTSPTFSGSRTGHWVTPRRQKPTTHGHDRLRDAIRARLEPSSKSRHGEDVQPV